MIKNKNFPFLIALLALISLCFLGVYLLFFQAFLLPWTSSANYNSNINGEKTELELGYDPMVTIVPKELQSEDPQSKFLISAADPKNGPDTAKVVLVEWSRFDSAAAASFSSLLSDLKTTYGDDLVIVWKDLANPSNEAEIGGQAAMAAHCASEQNAFWEYHNKLFANASSLKAANFSSYAGEMGLDATVFQACLDAKSTASIVNSNYFYAKNHDITAVPTAYVNDEQISDVTNLKQIKDLIDKKLSGYESAEY